MERCSSFSFKGRKFYMMLSRLFSKSILNLRSLYGRSKIWLEQLYINQHKNVVKNDSILNFIKHDESLTTSTMEAWIVYKLWLLAPSNFTCNAILSFVMCIYHDCLLPWKFWLLAHQILWVISSEQYTVLKRKYNRNVYIKN